jgi:ABC-2 type transporter.
MLLALVFSGFGLVISNYNETLRQAMLVMWFCIMIMLLMSGLFTPVRSMPYLAYLTTYINPMHYFIDAIRTVFVRGGDISSILPQIAALSIFAIVMDGLAILSYRKNK